MPRVRPTLVATLLASALAMAVPAPAGAVATSVPDAPVHLPTAIESMPPYQPQTVCDPVAKPGTRALAHLLTTTYGGTSIVSLTRPCGSDTSEHYDGRAVDWGVDHRNARLRGQGKAFLDWLFASDATGDDHAMVRRLGVMYVIWNRKIWGSWSGRWEPYSCSGATACHVDHMHISLDWSGAMRKTSFWTGVVRPPMDPPLVTIEPGSTVTTTVSSRQAPTPSYRLVAGGRYLFTVTGTYHYDGRRRHRADAECSTTDGTHWHPLAPADDGPGSGLLDLWVNGRHTWHTTSGGGCSATRHTYRQTIASTRRTPLALEIHDPGQWSSDGSLTVRVHRIR